MSPSLPSENLARHYLQDIRKLGQKRGAFTVADVSAELAVSPYVARKVLETLVLTGILNTEIKFTGTPGGPPRFYRVV